MADISMCVNKTCKQKETCYRFRARPSMFQSYISPNENDCKYYWEIEKETDENND